MDTNKDYWIDRIEQFIATDLIQTHRIQRKRFELHFFTVKTNPKQRDDYSCGIFTLMFFETVLIDPSCLTDGIFKWFTIDLVPKFRAKFASLFKSLAFPDDHESLDLYHKLNFIALIMDINSESSNLENDSQAVMVENGEQTSLVHTSQILLATTPDLEIFSGLDGSKEVFVAMKEFIDAIDELDKLERTLNSMTAIRLYNFYRCFQEIQWSNGKQKSIGATNQMIVRQLYPNVPSNQAKKISDSLYQKRLRGKNLADFLERLSLDPKGIIVIAR